MMHGLDLTEAGYRNIERGITGMSVSRLYQIAGILGVGNSELLPQYNGVDKIKEPDDIYANLKKSLEENYGQRIVQYKEENSFLKKRIEHLEAMLSRK